MITLRNRAVSKARPIQRARTVGGVANSAAAAASLSTRAGRKSSTTTTTMATINTNTNTNTNPATPGAPAKGVTFASTSPPGNATARSSIGSNNGTPVGTPGSVGSPSGSVNNDVTCCYAKFDMCICTEIDPSETCGKCRGSSVFHHRCQISLAEQLFLPEGDLRNRCLECFKEEYEIDDSDITELSEPLSNPKPSSVLTKPIPFFDDKLDLLKDVIGKVDVNVLPEQFDWSDAPRLPKIFVNYDMLRGRGRLVPQCLLKDAEGDFDKCLISIWWFSLSKRKRTEAFEDLKKIYRAPSKSNSPKKGTNAHAAASINAARAAGDAAGSANGEVYVGMADSFELRAEAAKKSYSYKNSKAGAKEPPKDKPRKAVDLRNREVRRCEQAMESLLVKHRTLTKAIPGCPAYNNLAIIHTYNVKDPGMKGRSYRRAILNDKPDPFLDDTRPIFNAYTHDESGLIELVGGASAMEAIEEKFQVRRHFASTDLADLPTRMLKNKAKRALPQTPGRGRKKLAALNAADDEEDVETGSEEEASPSPRRTRRKRAPSAKKKLTLDSISP